MLEGNLGSWGYDATGAKMRINYEAWWVGPTLASRESGGSLPMWDAFGVVKPHPKSLLMRFFTNCMADLRWAEMKAGKHESQAGYQVAQILSKMFGGK